MVLTSHYWQMVVLTSAGKRRLKEIPVAQHWAQTFLKDELAASETNDRDIQARLWQIWKTDEEEAPMALLCLRCWVSHQLAVVCYQLANQFGDSYGFEAAELWPFILDDSTQIELKTYKPFSLEILEKYDPAKSALSTWAQKIAKNHPDISRFCLERGLYRISDWALLNDTPLSRLANVLQSEASAYELEEKSALLAAYHRVYRRDRIIQRQKTGRTSRCQEPTFEQLTEISSREPPETVLQKLYELAHQLRSYTIAVRRGMPFNTQLNTQLDVAGQNQPITSAEEEEDSSAEDELVRRYRGHFLSSLDEAIKSVTLSYAESYTKKKQEKDKQKAHLFLMALRLFHCEGLSMGEIAKRMGISSQVQVTRLLRLKRFRTEVCAYWFNQLKQQVKTEALQFMAPERLSVISQQLETFLSEETELVIEEAAAEAQISKNRGTNSTFARRLCAQISDDS